MAWGALADGGTRLDWAIIRPDADTARSHLRPHSCVVHLGLRGCPVRARVRRRRRRNLNGGSTGPARVRGRPGADRAGVPGPAEWIRQTLWVETEFDSDGDGKRDRMFVDVTRPRQTETEGLKVPVVYESSPYFAGTSGPAAVSVGREAGSSARRRRRARRSRRSRSSRCAPNISNVAGDDLGAARLRRRPLRGAGHGTVAGLSDGRRRAGGARAEGRHRLAERPREGLHDDRRHRGGRARRGRRARSA